MVMKAMGCFASDLASLPAETVTCISDKWCQEAQQSYLLQRCRKKSSSVELGVYAVKRYVFSTQ